MLGIYMMGSRKYIKLSTHSLLILGIGLLACVECKYKYRCRNEDFKVGLREFWLDLTLYEVVCKGYGNIKLNDGTLHKKAFMSNDTNEVSDNIKYSKYSTKETPKLLILVLSGNNLTILDVNMFSDLLKLSRLDLSNNKLHTIATGLFDGNPALEIIHLQRNLITKVQYDFARLHNLKLLNMRQNLMNTFEKKLFKHLLFFGKSTTVLNLSKNRLQCDCNLSWLLDIQEHIGIKLILDTNQMCSETFGLNNVKLQCFVRYTIACDETQIKAYQRNCRIGPTSKPEIKYSTSQYAFGNYWLWNIMTVLSGVIISGLLLYRCGRILPQRSIVELERRMKKRSKQMKDVERRLSKDMKDMKELHGEFDEQSDVQRLLNNHKILDSLNNKIANPRERAKSMNIGKHSLSHSKDQPQDCNQVYQPGREYQQRSPSISYEQSYGNRHSISIDKDTLNDMSRVTSKQARRHTHDGITKQTLMPATNSQYPTSPNTQIGEEARFAANLNVGHPAKPTQFYLSPHSSSIQHDKQQLAGVVSNNQRANEVTQYYRRNSNVAPTVFNVPRPVVYHGDIKYTTGGQMPPTRLDKPSTTPCTTQLIANKQATQHPQIPPGSTARNSIPQITTPSKTPSNNTPKNQMYKPIQVYDNISSMSSARSERTFSSNINALATIQSTDSRLSNVSKLTMQNPAMQSSMPQTSVITNILDKPDNKR